jgi:hypothetical protein
MTPGEVAEFEKQYMPMITDLLFQFINSPAYLALPEAKRPRALTQRIHRLNVAYGATKRVSRAYAQRYKAGQLRPSGKSADVLREMVEEREAQQMEAFGEAGGKGDRY